MWFGNNLLTLWLRAFAKPVSMSLFLEAEKIIGLSNLCKHDFPDRFGLKFLQI